MVTMKTLTIKGQINDLAKSKLPSNLKIEAWDLDAKNHDKLGTSFVDASGKFEINFNESDFKDHPSDYAPDVYFKIFRAERLIKSTEKEVLKNLTDFSEELKVQINSNEMVPTLSKKTLGLKSGDLMTQNDETSEAMNTLLKEALSDYIVSKIPQENDRARQVLAKIPTQRELMHELSVKQYVSSEIAKLVVETPELEETLSGLENQFSEKETIAGVLHLDKPVSENPFLRTATRKTAFYNIAKSAELTDEKAIKLSDLLLLNQGNIDQMLSSAKSKKLISSNNIPALRVALFADRFTQHDEVFTKAILENTQIIKSATDVKPLRGLALLEEKEWNQLFKANSKWKDSFSSKSAYQDSLKKRIETAYSSDTVLHQMSLQDEKQLKVELKDAKSLLREGLSFDQWKNRKPENETFSMASKTEQEQWLKLRKTANRYALMGISEKLVDSNVSDTEKLKELKSAAGLITTFYNQNPDIDFQLVDFLRDESRNGNQKPINWSKIPPEKQKPLRNQLMAYQRILQLTPNGQEAIVLLESGYGAAQEIADTTETILMEQTGFNAEQTRRIYQMANSGTQAVALAFANHWEQNQTGLNLNNGILEIGNPDEVLQEMEGYQALFGNQNYCSCQHCKSIYSPAAYFVDLMRFINKNITTEVFNGQPTHPAYLRTRRPDLWKLPITCKNTNELVSHLSISNRVLASYIEDYKNDDPYEVLSRTTTTLQQPFNLQLTELKILLNEKGTDLYDLAKALNKSGSELARAIFGISLEVYNLTIEPLGRQTSTPEEVKKWLTLEDFTQVPVETFMQVTDLQRGELDTLFALPFFDTEGKVFIESIKTSSDDFAQFTEFINCSGLDTRSRSTFYDRINRFLRILTFTNWSLEELGYLVQQYNLYKDETSLIDNELIHWLSEFELLRREWKLSPDNLATFWGIISDSSSSEGNKSLFDQLFNQYLSEEQTPWLSGQLPDLVYEPFADNTDTSAITELDSNSKRVSDSLRLTTNEFNRLLIHLKDHLNSDSNGKFSLNDHFPILYQHALISNSLSLSIDQLFYLIYLSGNKDSALENTSSIISFLAFVRNLSIPYQKLVASPLFDIRPKPAPNMLSEVLNDWKERVVFSWNDLKSTFKLKKEFEEWVKKEVELGVVKSIEKEHFVITEKFYSKNYQPDEIFQKALIDKYPVDQLLKTFAAIWQADESLILQAASESSISLEDPKLLGAILDALFVNDEKSSQKGHVNSLLGKEVSEELMSFSIHLHSFLTDVTPPRPQAILLSSLVEYGLFSNDQSEYLAMYLKSNELSPITIGRIDLYYRLAPSNNEALLSAFHVLLSESNRLDINNKDQLKAVSELLDVDSTFIQSIVAADGVQNTLLTDLYTIKNKASICEDLGISISVLSQIFETDYAQLKTAVFSLESGVRSTYTEEEWNQVSEKMEGNLDELKRDALTDYLIRSGEVFSYPFKNEDDLLEYFLIDPEMSACSMTSLIKSATLSLQLYVQRCLSLAEYHFFREISPDLDFSEVNFETINKEWEWRKNYRVWEANRKVFLYPENYLEPGLRDDKSPEFKELEEALLQQDLTENATEDIFKRYFNQVHDLSRLKIGGNYYDEQSNTLYLLGSTNDNPKQYYYRTRVNGHQWTHWQNIDVSIENEDVSPVVFRGKLYLCWIERAEQDKIALLKNEEDSNSMLKDVHYNLRFTYQRKNNDWSAVQTVFLFSLPGVKSQIEEFNFKFFLEATNDHIEVIHSSYIYDNNSPFFENGRERKQIDLYNKKAKRIKFNKRSEESIQFEMNDRILLNLLDWRGEKALYVHEYTDPKSDTYKYKFIRRPYDEYIATYGPLASERIPISSQELGIDIVYNQKKADTIFREKDQHYYVKSKTFAVSSHSANLEPELQFSRLSTVGFYELSNKLSVEGLDGLLSVSSQLTEEMNSLIVPTPESPVKLYLSDKIDFNGAYGNYYEEVFFHIPYTLANHFNAVGKFKEAQKWYHYIFNPLSITNENGSMHQWNYLPFRKETSESLEEILTNGAAINQYKTDPFNPHAIARLRENAFKKAIVMKYIDNLLDWGDQLFRQNTRESINEAMIVYLLASDILGKRPAELGDCAKTHPELESYREQLTYEMVRTHFEEKSTFLHVLENKWRDLILLFEDLRTGNAANGSLIGQTDTVPYALFCIPNNTLLVQYWDRLEDRLFKIRKCQNIKGITQELELYQPPIDPLLLIRAKAAGLNIQDVLSQNQQMVNYRFIYLLEKAKSYAAQVQQIGSAMQAALERKDQEELLQLTAVQERNLMQLATNIRMQQVEEANQQIKALEASRKNVEARYNWFSKQISGGLNNSEKAQQIFHQNAIELQRSSSMANWIASQLFQIPQFEAGAFPSSTFGGIQLGGMSRAIGEQLGVLSSITSMKSSAFGLASGFERRNLDWEFQRDSSARELAIFDRQILAANIRLSMAEKELENQRVQASYLKEIHDFHKEKLTNLGLYDWMSRELRGMYASVFELAHKMANRALMAFKHQYKANTDVTIGNDHWNNGKEGLLAGEKLMQDLLNLETSYIEHEMPSMEIRQSFSLVQLSPMELLRLRETGECTFDIPQFAFDLLYPGHSDRKIKSVSMTIPAVTGPYVNIGCELSLLSDNAIGGNVIAVSHGINDHGKFELNFNGERLMPFEGVNAISSWNIKLPNQLRAFDYDSIGDVILHISYTAKQGDRATRESVENALANDILNHLPGNALEKMMSMKTEMSENFYQLKQGLKVNGTSNVTLQIRKEQFPYFLVDKNLNLSALQVFVKSEGEFSSALACNFYRTGNIDAQSEQEFDTVDETMSYHRASFSDFDSEESILGEWQFSLIGSSADEFSIDDIFFLFQYKIQDA